jgi:hypothetical protein
MSEAGDEVCDEVCELSVEGNSGLEDGGYDGVRFDLSRLDRFVRRAVTRRRV